MGSDTAATAFSRRLADAVKRTREAQGLSAAALASRSGVSRAMIGRIELGEANPTALLLSRLSGALRVTLSELIGQAEDGAGPLVRHPAQAVWTDPTTGYQRRAISPASSGSIQLVEVVLPPGSSVAFGADAYRFIEQQIWVLEGRLSFTEGDQEHILEAGDCLLLGQPSDCVFHNPTATACRYLVAITPRRASRL